MEEKVFYQTKDNIKLCGILSVVNQEKEIVVLCHGLMGDKNDSDHFKDLSSTLHKNNINTFRFDFRAHGESEGNDYEMTPLKELIDLETTIDFLLEKGFDSIYLLGASFGGSVVSSINFKKYSCIKKLILWYGLLDFSKTFTDFFTEESEQEANKTGFKVIKSNRPGITFKLGKNLYQEIKDKKPYENLLDLEIPILFVHGTLDSIIPYQSSKDVTEKCKNATLKLIENESHAFRKSKEELEEAIRSTVEFIKS